MKNSTLVLYGLLIGACALLWGLIGWKVSLLCFGLFHLCMWVNVTMTTLSNALVGRTVSENDAWYRILCIILGCVCVAMVII